MRARQPSGGGALASQQPAGCLIAGSRAGVTDLFPGPAAASERAAPTPAQDAGLRHEPGRRTQVARPRRPHRRAAVVDRRKRQQTAGLGSILSCAEPSGEARWR